MRSPPSVASRVRARKWLTRSVPRAPQSMDDRCDPTVARAQAAVRRAHQAAGDVAVTAGRIAAVVGDVAMTWERRAVLAPERAGEMRARAARLREFAQQEKQEERRLQGIRDGADRV